MQAHGFRITDTFPDQPFTFAQVDKIRKITKIRITLTLFSGNTAPGDTDENQLTLALDGIDTGLVLNGFRDWETDTQTIGGTPKNEAQIRAALQADGELHATIIDADPADGVINGTSQWNTTLMLKGKARR